MEEFVGEHYLSSERSFLLNESGIMLSGMPDLWTLKGLCFCSKAVVDSWGREELGFWLSTFCYKECFQ